jgi:hypothetical protein
VRWADARTADPDEGLATLRIVAMTAVSALNGIIRWALEDKTDEKL